MATVGERLKQAREAAGMSARGLAEIAGGSHTNVRRIESGEQPTPGAAKLAKYADALGVSVAWLLTGEGPRERASAERTVELDGDVDPLIAQVGKRLELPAHVVRAAHDLRGAHGTAGLTEADVETLLRSLASAAKLAELQSAAAGAGVKAPSGKVHERERVEDAGDFGPPKPKRTRR